MKNLSALWTRFWFDGGSPTNLAAARIVVASHALWIVLSRDFAGVSGLPPVFWSGVEPGWQWRYLLFPNNMMIEQVLQWVATVALFAVLLGVFPRVAALVAGLLLYHLAPLESIIWNPNPAIRGLTITVPALVILAMSRCGDALALKRRTSTSSTDPGMHYGWQLKAILLLIAQVYLFSAFAKINSLGFAWISGENMRNWLLYLSQAPDTAVFTTLGPWLASNVTLGLIASAATIVFELVFIAVLFSARARRWLVPLAVLFHTVILFAMNITFPAMPLLLLFVNWDWVARRTAERRALATA